MVTAQRRKEWRDQLRARGFKQLEVWLPAHAIDELDRIKASRGLVSRNEALMLVVEKQLGKPGSPLERAESPVDGEMPSSGPNSPMALRAPPRANLKDCWPVSLSSSRQSAARRE